MLRSITDGETRIELFSRSLITSSYISIMAVYNIIKINTSYNDPVTGTSYLFTTRDKVSPRSSHFNWASTHFSSLLILRKDLSLTQMLPFFVAFQERDCTFLVKASAGLYNNRSFCLPYVKIVMVTILHDNMATAIPCHWYLVESSMISWTLSQSLRKIKSFNKFRQQIPTPNDCWFIIKKTPPLSIW